MGWFDRILRSCSHRADFILRLSTSYLFRLRQEKIVKGDPLHGPHQRYFSTCKATAYWSRTGLKSWDQSLRCNRQKLCVLNCVWLFETWASVSIWFHRQEYWRGLPFFPPGDLSDPGIEPISPASPSLAGRFLALSYLGSPWGATDYPQIPAFPKAGKRVGKLRLTPQR